MRLDGVANERELVAPPGVREDATAGLVEPNHAMEFACMKPYPRRSLTLDEFERLLAEHGYVLTRTKTHRVYRHTITNQAVTVSASRGHPVEKETVENTMRAVVRNEQV